MSRAGETAPDPVEVGGRFAAGGADDGYDVVRTSVTRSVPGGAIGLFSPK
jgi:hypothetical protein